MTDERREAGVFRSSRSGTMPRRILIAAAAALLPVIAGCEAGLNAPSLQWHQPAEGTGKTIGNSGITISNAFVLGAPIGKVLRPGQNAGLFLGLVNTGAKPDQLLSITAPGTAQSVSLPAGGIHLWRDHSVLLTGPQAAVILENLRKPLTGGSVIKLTLDFKRAGLVHLVVPVMARARFYATLSPAPAPSSAAASPSPSASGRTSATPSPSPSPSR